MCKSQIFQGEIIYSNDYRSKLSTVKDKMLNSMMGTKQIYFIKDGDYKSVFNGVFIKMQVYKNNENKMYTLTAKSDTLFWEDYNDNKEIPISCEIKQNQDTILGIVCNLIIAKTEKTSMKFYYNVKYGINPEFFKKHNFGNFYYIISKTKSLPLKTIYETNEYTVTSIATEIKDIKLDDSFFEIIDKNKIKKAYW